MQNYHENREFIESFNKNINNKKCIIDILNIIPDIANLIVSYLTEQEIYRLVLCYTLKNKYNIIDNKIIDTGGYIWLYIENDVTRYYANIDKTYKKVAFYGPVITISNYWLAYSDYEYIKFSGLHKLKNIGTNWMNYCIYLISVDFNGLLNLENIESDFLCNCSFLETIITCYIDKQIFVFPTSYNHIKIIYI